MFDVSYNAPMGRKIAPEERRDFQVGFRTTHRNGQRLETLIARILSANRRVERTEIYEELMGLKQPELITQEDRQYLLGLRETLPDPDDLSLVRGVAPKASRRFRKVL